MGIQGLLPAIKSATSPINVKEYAGMRAAVDTYSWLHKAAFSCSRDICRGHTTTRFMDYCMHRVNLLRHHGVKPLLIFDGGKLPMKNEQEEKRSKSRKENLKRAHEFEASGNHAVAYECYQKAVDITPEIALQLIEVLRKQNVDFIVAPFEADAQMAYLVASGLVDVVITEDSDLVAYGCARIFFKMDKFGEGVEFKYADLVKSTELNFTNFTRKMVLEMCILSGCDYLPSLQGMGIKRAHNLMKRFRSYQKIIKHLRFSGATIPRVYEENFARAVLTFCHHRVYDPILEDITHLTQVPEDLEMDLEFLGPRLAQNLAKQIAEGYVNPVTHQPFQDVSSQEEFLVSPTLQYDHKRKQRNLDLPVQKNVLTNYFISKSDASQQQFKTPRTLASGSSVIAEQPASQLTDEGSDDEDLGKHQVPVTRSSSSIQSDSEEDCLTQEEMAMEEIATPAVKVRRVRSRFFPEPDEIRNDENSEDDARHCSSSATTDRGKKRVATKQTRTSRACKITRTHAVVTPKGSSLLGSIDRGVCLSAKVDHVKEYSSIAQASLDKFSAAISSFKCSGARVSGLRAPLKINLTNVER